MSNAVDRISDNIKELTGEMFARSMSANVEYPYNTAFDSIEVLQVYISELERRIKELENNLADKLGEL